MADGTAPGQSHPGLQGRGGAVDGIAEEKLGIDRAPFTGGHVAPVEAGRDELFARGIGQLVAGELFDGELVERQVAIESPHHPVAVSPHLPQVVEMQAVGVGIAGDVEPVPGHLFAIPRRREIAVHHVFVRLRRGVGFERLDLGRRGGQPGEGEGHPANQRRLARFGARLEPLLAHPGQQKTVDRVLLPARLVRRGDLRLDRRAERPVPLVLGSLFNPLLEQLFLSVGQRLLGGGRGHHQRLVGREDALPHFTLVEGTSRQGGPRVALGQGGLGHIQPQVGLAGLGIRAVAGETMGRENGQNIAPKLHLIGPPDGGGLHERPQQGEQPQEPPEPPRLQGLAGRRGEREGHGANLGRTIGHEDRGQTPPATGERFTQVSVYR